MTKEDQNQCLHCRLVDTTKAWAEEVGADEGEFVATDGSEIANCFARAFMEMVINAEPGDRQRLFICHLDILMELGASVGIVVMTKENKPPPSKNQIN